MQNSVILGICSVPSLSCSVPIILQNSAEFCRIGTKIGHTFSPLLWHINRIQRHVVKDKSKFDSLHLSKVIFNHDKYVQMIIEKILQNSAECKNGTKNGHSHFKMDTVIINLRRAYLYVCDAIFIPFCYP